MVNNEIENLFKKHRISKLNELKIERYVNFFDNSYKEKAKDFLQNIVMPYIEKILRVIK